MAKEKVSKVADESMIQAAFAVIKEHAAPKENGVYYLSASAIQDFYKDQGIPTAVQNKMSATRDAMLAASIDFIGAQLDTDIKSIKASGEKPDILKVDMELPLPGQKMIVTMNAHTAHKIPTHLPSMAGRQGSDGELAHQYGKVTIKTKTTSILSNRKEQLDTWSSKIKSSLDVD